MTSNAETNLCFVSWNTNGIKEKIVEILDVLCNLQADIVFLQETHVGPTTKCLQAINKAKNWKVYFTEYSSQNKGVAILIRDTVQFEYICHDVDSSGGYIVLFCHLYGELYTLVNVCKHKKDKIVLNSLKDYLMERAEGVLVVGGDFNSLLDPRVDHNPPKSRESPSKVLEDFIASLNLRDTWSNIHTDNDTERFTFKYPRGYSRRDMFFLQNATINQVLSITVEKGLEGQKMDHFPLVLKLPTRLRTYEYNPDRCQGKISLKEILSAIKYLTDKEEPRPNMNDEMDYKTKCCTLKIKYNKILNTLKVPKNYKPSGDNNMEYLIFSEILAKRLLPFSSCETDNCAPVNIESPQQIKWSYLKTIFDKLDYCYYKEKDPKQAPFAPPPDLRILDRLLPKVQSSTEDLRVLQPDCPLANAILNLANKQLVDMLQLFQNDSGLKLNTVLHGLKQTHTHK
ncbi:uncharacterized protein LOC108278470 isoform X2 [Ictalurus punctatus]|uniref:exodeoxyribonuclease III n=1 Tax=Ictalurus punctatus TaxID=7998 RepID=A0A2D0SXE3_ICTPU|nr:uncharacterized protein LOC108278470 isoform X2 [Ictalurus punctatus]XP_017347358.1 uncharacterized protein LOC108278470 isoform X2 [Ictalurus punctatus]XP_053536278.1 uncharacterized protein LOC108278470 isoform X2 [Ictalurus punctatus]XP_053536289.1 uncharacterized protein LOC108278470 isoform X2 [Ictalurus punctatus]